MCIHLVYIFFRVTHASVHGIHTYFILITYQIEVFPLLALSSQIKRSRKWCTTNVNKSFIKILSIYLYLCLQSVLQPTAVYLFPINNFDRVARRRQYLPVYLYIRPCLKGLDVIPFNWDFIAIVILQDDREPIHRLNLNLKNHRASFSLVLYLWPVRQGRPYQ